MEGAALLEALAHGEARAAGGKLREAGCYGVRVFGVRGKRRCRLSRNAKAAEPAQGDHRVWGIGFGNKPDEKTVGYEPRCASPDFGGPTSARLTFGVVPRTGTSAEPAC